MNIGVEYLQRTGIWKDKASYPCSLFLMAEDGLKLVVVVDRHNDQFIVKKWDLAACEQETMLPPVEEVLLPELDDSLIVSGYYILDCAAASIPNDIPTKPRYRYEDYFDRFLSDFKLHKQTKERWLWKAFVEVYLPDLQIHSMSIKRNMFLTLPYADRELLNDQKEIVYEKFPLVWKSWTLWRRHMLDFDGDIPGEFIFWHMYQRGTVNNSSLRGIGT